MDREEDKTFKSIYLQDKANETNNKKRKRMSTKVQAQVLCYDDLSDGDNVEEIWFV